MKDLLDLAVKTRPLKLNEKLRTAYNLGNVSLAKLGNGNYLASVRQFNYNFLGSFGRLQYKHYKDKMRYDQYIAEFKKKMKQEFPSFQVKDLEHLYD